MTSSAGLAESSLRTPRRYGSLRRREVADSITEQVNALIKEG